MNDPPLQKGFWFVSSFHSFCSYIILRSLFLSDLQIFDSEFLVLQKKVYNNKVRLAWD